MTKELRKQLQLLLFQHPEPLVPLQLHGLAMIQPEECLRLIREGQCVVLSRSKVEEIIAALGNVDP